MHQIPLARVCETRYEVSILKSPSRHPMDTGYAFITPPAQSHLTVTGKTFTTLCERICPGDFE
jgi:hypothetical protein